MTKMITRQYTVRFLTPAFLGNAEQSGEWRTPPFKALLRQWWRVAVAAEMNYDIDAMRKREGELFGVTADGDSRRSQVRMRLSPWTTGTLQSWNGLDAQRVNHPEVGQNGTQVGAHLYLGYGPLTYDRQSRSTALKAKAAIQAGETSELRLAFPGEHAEALDTALWLMDHYGTLGGRSRNGWGSFSLAPINSTPALAGKLNGNLSRDWQQALALDWPHAIGAAKDANDNAQPLIWQTEPFNDWKAVMKRLAELKIGLRVQLFPLSVDQAADDRPKMRNDRQVGIDHGVPQKRHWLSYPTTNHDVVPWKSNKDNSGRLPNSLRFKVRADGARLRGVIYHVPCIPPREFDPDLHAIRQVWQDVHAFLDSPAQNLTRIAA